MPCPRRHNFSFIISVGIKSSATDDVDSWSLVLGDWSLSRDHRDIVEISSRHGPTDRRSRFTCLTNKRFLQISPNEHAAVELLRLAGPLSMLPRNLKSRSKMRKSRAKVCTFPNANILSLAAMGEDPTWDQRVHHAESSAAEAPES